MLKTSVLDQPGFHYDHEMQANHEMEVVVAHPLAIPSNAMVHVNPQMRRSLLQDEMATTIQVQQAMVDLAINVPYVDSSMLEADSSLPSYA